MRLTFTPPFSTAIIPLFFFQAEAGIRDLTVTGVQTCALPICSAVIPTRLGPVFIAWSASGFTGLQIGRASCRERVWISVVAVSLKKKKGVRGLAASLDCGKGTTEGGRSVMYLMC